MAKKPQFGISNAGDLFEKFGACLDAGGARIAPEVLFGRLKNLERLSACELTAAG